MTDAQLLEQYVQSHSEQAFAELVRRHIDWVHSAAVRQVRDGHVAEDVTQAVFIALAQQAHRLRPQQPLSPWLFQVMRYVSANARRSEFRRRRHEQRAAAMVNECSSPAAEVDWGQLAPALDELVAGLRTSDRQAVLLRFYERKSFAEVGQALGISEEAARKRTDRAVAKLRTLFGRQGTAVTSSAGLAATLVAYTTQPADAGLLAATTGQALAATGPTAAGLGQGWSLAQVALRMMAWAKLKAAAVVLVAALGAGGAGTAAVVMTWPAAPDPNPSQPQRPASGTAVLPSTAASATPTGHSQGYRMPQFREIRASDNGDLLIVSLDPRNKAREGYRVEGTYRDGLRDNWGNLYLRYYDTSTPDGRLYQYYMPLPPPRLGQGAHTLRLRYTARDVDLAKSSMSYEAVVGEQEVPIPAPLPSARGIPADWYRANEARDPFWKLQALRVQYYSDLPYAGLQYVQGRLGEDPQSLYLLDWKRRCLKDLGDEAGARVIVNVLKDKALAAPFQSWITDGALKAHLLQLARDGKMDQFWGIVQALETARDRKLASVPRQNREPLERTIKGSELYEFLTAREGLEALDALPKPTVQKIVRSQDGHVSMVVLLPPGNRRSQFGGGFWLSEWSVAQLPGSTWNKTLSLLDQDKLRLSFKGRGDKVDLVFDPLVVSEDKGRARELRLPWVLAVSVPAPTVKDREELDRQFANWNGRGEPSTSPQQAAWRKRANQAWELFSAQRYEEALKLYQAIADTPLNQWPTQHEKADIDAYLKQQSLLDYRLQIAGCLTNLGRVDEAEALLDRLDHQVANTPEFPGVEAIHQSHGVLVARAAIANYLIDHGRLDEAAALLDRTNRLRPDFRTLDDLDQVKPVPFGQMGWNERQQLARIWRAVDIAMWKLDKARQAAANPPL